MRGENGCQNHRRRISLSKIRFTNLAAVRQLGGRAGGDHVIGPQETRTAKMHKRTIEAELGSRRPDFARHSAWRWEHGLRWRIPKYAAILSCSLQSFGEI